MTHPEEFTQRYSALLRHYGITPKAINRNRPNENGDIEQRNYRFKKAVDQALMLRGSRDFIDRKEYASFLQKLFVQLNSGRLAGLAEEIAVIKVLPARRLDAVRRQQVKVGPSSTIRVNHNTYSVNSRLIGEVVEVRLYAERIEVFYAQQCVETIPRLRGENGHRIEYRHIIEWLVRKPGAFENYRFREDLFPTHHFRVTYDQFKNESSVSANKKYLSILFLAAREGEATVDDALRRLINGGIRITDESVVAEIRLAQERHFPSVKQVYVAPVNLCSYDVLLCSVEAAL